MSGNWCLVIVIEMRYREEREDRRGAYCVLRNVRWQEAQRRDASLFVLSGSKIFTHPGEGIACCADSYSREFCHFGIVEEMFAVVGGEKVRFGFRGGEEDGDILGIANKVKILFYFLGQGVGDDFNARVFECLPELGQGVGNFPRQGSLCFCYHMFVDEQEYLGAFG